MVSPPYSSVCIYLFGTPVSVISNTSRRQQQAKQVEQLTDGSVTCVVSIFMAGLFPGVCLRWVKRAVSGYWPVTSDGTLALIIGIHLLSKQVVSHYEGASAVI
jgi:Mg2+/citrate symporter